MITTTTLESRIGRPDLSTTVQEMAAALAGRFAPIGLRQMNAVALLDRHETKYVLSRAQLARVLADVPCAYRILEVKGRRLQRYRSLYFDSADFTLYHRHHAGARNRYKVRSRAYVDSRRYFLEVKQKTNKKRTRKQRLRTDAPVRVLGGDAWRFVADATPLHVDALYGRLTTAYARLTLVNQADPERITIDFDLRFSNRGRHVSVPHIAVVELKRDGRHAPSAFGDALRRHGIRPHRFSKYCTGVNLLFPDVKHNRFKPTLRLIDKLSQESDRVIIH